MKICCLMLALKHLIRENIGNLLEQEENQMLKV